MRIERLSLDFFGHFTGKVLDFGKAGQASDFHLIYGSNEAGKTTTMEAYLRLLYGFPHREPYAFQHKRQNLRVSGLLDIGAESRPFTRLPSRSGNLRGEADAPLPEAAIAVCLGGLSLEDYRSLLCLDDDTIEKGGEDIANARGDIGKLLFSAAAGVANLNAVLEQAGTEADGLYKKRASTTRFAELKRELTEVEGSIREMDVNAHAWRKLKEALQTARDDEAKAREARDTLRGEQARIAALRRALPNLGELDRLEAEIADCADYPDRIDITREDLGALISEWGQTVADLRRVKTSLDKNRPMLANLHPDMETLALAERLDDLDELRARTQTAMLDIPRRERLHEEAKTDMKRIARDLGAPEDCDTGRLVMTMADIAALEKLRDAMRDATGARESGEREMTDLRGRVAEARKAHQRLIDDPPARTGIMDLLSRFDIDTLAPAVAAAEQAIATADAALREALDALAIGACTFSVLPGCPADPSTAAEFAERHADLAETIARRDDELDRLEEDIAANAASLARLASDAGVASDEEAREAQARRDGLWRAHRDVLTGESADDFSRAMDEVDDINAARLGHAAELGEIRTVRQSLEEKRARRAKRREQRGRLTGQMKEIETRVQGLATEIGLPSLSPATFSNWVASHARAAAAARGRQVLADQHRETLNCAERLCEELAALVEIEAPTLETALPAARRLAETERAYRDKLREASERMTALQDESDRRHLEQTALEEAAEHASAAWNAKVQAVSGGMLLADRLAEAPGQLGELRECDTRRLQANRQISTMRDDQRRFSEAVKNLGTDFGVTEKDPLEIFRRLREVASQAQADKTRHADLSAIVEKDAKWRAELEAKLEDLDRKVRDMGAVYPETVDVSTLDALRIADATARDVIEKRQRIAELKRLILNDLSLPDIDKARALIGDQSVSALEAMADALETDLEHAEERVKAATVVWAHAERDLDAVTGGADIAELVERRTTLQLQMEEALLDYLERTLGLRIAEDAIRRYRDRHRSEMMASTEQAFSELTNGAYRTLLTQPDGASEILLAVDANGISKQVGDMSKGTRFQLYLALRAAAYEQMVRQDVRLPFFCDDVFETFDEDRTRAACRLMERIGRSGQAIYLTHHRHVVDIARDVCDAPPVVHNL